MLIRILLVDRHAILRDGLCSLIEKHPHLAVVGQAANGPDAVALARKHQPDIVIMDANMLDLNSIDATIEITKELANTKVLALASHANRQLIAHMLQAGALGYVLKDSNFDQLHRAIRAVSGGRRYLNPEVSDIMVSDYANQPMSLDSGTLTHREQEVLQLLTQGKSTNEIAKKLNISSRTVEAHRSELMNKLGIDNIAALTKYAIREGLTSLDS